MIHDIRKIMSRFFALAPMGAAALMTGCNSAPDIEQQVNELYNKMSNEERIAQLRSMYMDELFNEQGKLDTAMCRKLIPNGIGHFSQFAMQKPSPEHLTNCATVPQPFRTGLYITRPTAFPRCFTRKF